MSAKKLSKGERKVIKCYNGTVKGTHLATGLSYAYCCKVLQFDYILAAIKKRDESKKDKSEDQDKPKVDKRLRNEFWKARSSHGRKPIFINSEKLLTACIEYFEWVSANPLYELKAFPSKGFVRTKAMPKMRAMTIGGLCIFLDINPSTWFYYAKKEAYSNVTTQVEEIIRDQKFSGAAAGFLKESIIARDLGLVDKVDTTIRNPEGRAFNMNFIRSPKKEED